MNTFDMIKKQLVTMGADGLCNSETECGCTLADFAPCEEGHTMDCEAAQRTASEDTCEDGNCYNHMIPFETPLDPL
jgi:hypothetical protein